MIQNLLLFLPCVAALSWLQFSFMRKKADKKDYVLVSLLMTISVVIGILLILDVPVVSPSAAFRKWVTALG